MSTITESKVVADHPLHIENVFELHRRSDTPSHRLLVVFSAANASSFTFFKAVKDMQPDRLHIRDPFGNAWYQNGLAEGEDLAAITDRIAAIAADYKEVWMIGSSMGAYAALYFGPLVKARHVLAIAPQILVDSKFSRGPRSAINIQTPSIVDHVLAAKRTQCTIIFGSFDLVDAYNISQIYKGDSLPLHVRVIQYLGQDHMLPIQLDQDHTLKRYFQLILSHNSLPLTGAPFSEGRPLPKDHLAVLHEYIQLTLQDRQAEAYEMVRATIAKPAFADWDPLLYYGLRSGYLAGGRVAEITPLACALSDRHPSAIDFAFLAAQCCEELADKSTTQRYLDRVFEVRKSHPAGRKMQTRLLAESS